MKAALLSLWLFVIPVYGNDSGLEDIPALKAVESVHILRTNFVQTRQIEALSRPLISTGRMILSKKDGLFWHMVSPFAVQLLISKDRLIQLDDEGERSEVKAVDQPVLHSLSEVFMALFSGNMRAIHKNFTRLEFKKENGTWQVTFQPKKTLLKSIIKTVSLSGVDTLETVVILEANGDSTEMKFTKTTYDRPAQLTPEEQSALDTLLKE